MAKSPVGLIIDTSVLVDFRRDHADAVPYLLGLLDKNAASIHPVCAAEMLDGALDQADMRRTIQFLAAFKRLVIKSADFESCLSLVSQARLSHGIGWPDCLIAATCIRLQRPLVTTNDRHFRAVRGLRVIRPY
jgi:predicted nucleic acid-binding protein